MFKQCRILDKITNQIFQGQIDTNLEAQEFYNLVEIPDDNNLYKWDSETKTVIIYTDITNLVNQKIQDDITNRNNRLQAGVMVDSVLYDMNTEAKSNIMAILSSIDDNTTINYIDYNFNTVILNKTQLQNVLKSIIQTTASIYNKNAENQKAFSKSDITLDELNGINIDYTGL